MKYHIFNNLKKESLKRCNFFKVLLKNSKYIFILNLNLFYENNFFNTNKININ